MSEQHSEAMRLAIELHKGTGVSADQLVHAAEMIRLYRDGALKITIRSAFNHDRDRGRFPVNDGDGVRKNFANVFPVDVDLASRNVSNFPVGIGEATGNDLNKVFTGHESSSSVVADGESGDSVAADPRNDATPDTSAKGVRDDA